ncbi:MAG: signal recognition particle-docking protein FtsY [Gammaproteobacteria bacterium]|nr:signal recognition particle-docking protein FtsY [Gammaproteobacteria bacterium]MDA8024540.1 signal recognition particle-docking protein FtsY [Gammaproteobacteria bacterium]
MQDSGDAKNGAGVFARLQKTRRKLERGLAGLLAPGGRGGAQLDELHDQLLLADVGVEASGRIIDNLRGAAKKQNDGGALRGALRDSLAEILSACEAPAPPPPQKLPRVILMIGVNGAGKTTTLAKLARALQRDGARVMLAACDTFRAAAIGQLQTWGERLDAPVIAQAHGADPAAVAFDAYAAACARGADALLIDTAGRQHTDAGLMEQLKKIRRVLQKAGDDLPHETLLTLDAGTGQNALSQVEHFHRAFGVDGLCVTKLDGTAKGGVVVALAMRFGLPVRWLGVGESLDDLRPFSAAEYAAALLPAEGGGAPGSKV